MIEPSSTAANAQRTANPILLTLDEQWRAAMAAMDEEFGSEEEEEAEAEGNDRLAEERETQAEGADPEPEQEEGGEDDDAWAQHPNPLPGIISDSLPSPMEQDDTRRMKLTFDEWEIAWNIKGIIQTANYVDNISDFSIAQLAIISNDTAIPEEDALQRAMNLQAFREKYGIRDTYEEGCRALNDLVRLIPGFYLHFGFHREKGTYTIVKDMVGLDVSVLTSEANFKKLAVGYYYFLHSFNVDMESIRKGFLGVVDCEGVGWKMKKEFKTLKELFGQLHAIYPFRILTVKHYNTSMIFNILFNIAKRVLPEKVREQLEFGYTKEERLRDIFCVPTRDAATLRIILQMQNALKRRYDNESTFSLH